MPLDFAHDGMPEPPFDQGEPGVPYVQAQAQIPILAPTRKQVERLPAARLIEFFRAWETAKEAENISMWEAARYYHSKQWTDAELRALKRRKQPVITKNRIKRKVDFLVGMEQRYRRDPKAFPRFPGAEQAAPVATACLRYVQDVNKWQNLASECSSEALIRGVGIAWHGIQVVKGRAEIRKHRVPTDRFFYDPRSEMWDFSDARYLGEHQWLDIDQAKETMPWAAELIELIATAHDGGNQTGLPQISEKEKNWVDSKARRIRLVCIWYKHEGCWLYDYIVGQMSLCPDGNTTDAAGQPIPAMDCYSPYLDEDGNPVHPYIGWSPYVDERGDRYGIVRDMIPIQDEINKRSSKMLHMLTVRQTRADIGAIDDVDAMKAELAKPDGHVTTRQGATFEILDQSAQVQGQYELLQEGKAEIENLGPNPGLAGRGVEKQSGRAILAQQNSGATELSPVFERLREWKLRCYHRDWMLMRQFWRSERFVRVTGNPDAIKFLTVNKIETDPATGHAMVQNSIADMDVDIILDEGPDTVTMREELIEGLAQLGPGAVPPELLIELSSLPDKDLILEKLGKFKSPPPDVQEMQKRMAQLEELQKSAEVDKTQSEVEANRAKVVDTMVKAMQPPEAMDNFPLHYGAPTFLDKAVKLIGQGPMMPNALAGPPGAPKPPGPAGGPPVMQQPGPDQFSGQQPGAEASQDYLSQMAPYPDPTVPHEPRIGERGGLPLGPV